jgi:hypothetical protein
MFSALINGTTFGWPTLSGLMVFPSARIGVPVISVSSLSFMMGKILSLVIVFRE